MSALAELKALIFSKVLAPSLTEPTEGASVSSVGSPPGACENSQPRTTDADGKRYCHFYEERAAVREYDGGASRADAEAGAFADCVARWRALNPLSASGDCACVHCGKARPDTPVLARGGHAWLHRACWAAMNAARDAAARAAVLAMLRQPD